MANPELRKTILLGLGGAGQLILLNVKRLFLDTLNVVPPCVKFLSLDTDSSIGKLRSNVRDEEYTLAPQEFLHLKVAQAREFVKSDPVVREWYVGNVTVAALENGAGAIRQNGRVALFNHIVEVRRRIDQLATQLNDNQLFDRMRMARQDLGATTDFKLSDKAPEVYVCGSLAGGTGSGTFIDMGILLRNALPTALIHGFFLLNWVYRNKAFAYRVQGNAYAALAELDNLQSIKYGAPGFVPYEMQYADQKITVEDPPYSLFHVIDGRNERGENVDDVKELCDSVANAIFLSVGAMNYPAASVVDNLLAFISIDSPRIWGGRYARYSSLGVSALYYPAPELQRLLVADNALALCRAAIADVETGSLAGAAVLDRGAIGDDVNRFLTDQQIAPDLVGGQVCPSDLDIAFQVEPFEIEDPTLLAPRAEAERAELEDRLRQAFDGEGKPFINRTVDAIKAKLQELARNQELSVSYRHQWCDWAIQRLQEFDHDAAARLADATRRVDELREKAAELLRVVEKSRLLPWIGGPRKSAAGRWGGVVEDLLRAVKDKVVVECERSFYEAALECLNQERPSAVPAASAAMQALDRAAAELATRANLEDRNLKQLRAKRVLTLIGDGYWVILPDGKAPFVSRDSVRLSYDDFKSQNGIHTTDDYVKKDKEVAQRLAGCFLAHCQQKLDHLTKVTVHQALATLGNHRGDLTAYLTEQFEQLFRKAAPLWSFHRSRLSAAQGLRYDHILNLGVDDPDSANGAYGAIIDATKARNSIQCDHAFSASGDPHRIWLLSYAAALPVYFLQGIEQSRERYDDEITPTYHIDPYFEMNVPDLFPVDDIDNRALRILAMAIVNGIDVIQDEKLPKGHKFVCDLPAVKQMNAGEPKVWLLFHELFAEVKADYAKRRETNLLNELAHALKERMGSMSRDELRRAIDAHIKKFENKLADRDFSKLKSARLTYRELQALKGFLSPKGYNMDVERYIAGS